MNLKFFVKFISVLAVLGLLLMYVTPVLAVEPTPPVIHSPAVILIESGTGRVLYERNMHERRYPASITKVMTAIIVLEELELDEIITISSEVVDTIRPGYASASLLEGEELTAYQLLNLIMVVSANDAANALAKHISGSIEEFAVLMTTRARELGMNNTNFMNPSGLHHANHYSTAYDLALLGIYALQNSTLRRISGTPLFVLPATNMTETPRNFHNTNLLLLPQSSRKS